MNSHVQQTLAVIEDRIRQLQHLAVEIRSLMGTGEIYPGASGNGVRPRIRHQRRRRPKAKLISPTPRAERRSRAGGLVDAVRNIVAGREGKFTRVVMQSLVLERHPELEMKIGGLGVALIDMANRGELIRTGAGRNAVYRRANLKSASSPISATETAYREFRSTVPAPPSTE